MGHLLQNTILSCKIIKPVEISDSNTYKEKL